MEEQLIELVRQHEVLYNVKLKEYRDKSLRLCAWEDIASKLNMPVLQCRESWVKLRNCFHNALRRNIKKHGQVMASNVVWKYEREMAYLVPFMESRPKNRNSQRLKYSIPGYQKPVTTKSRKLVPAEPNPYSEDAELLQTQQTLSNERLAEMDEADLFFLSMSRSLKKLPKIDQTRIKMELHKAISECELRELHGYEMRRFNDQQHNPHPNIANVAILEDVKNFLDQQ